MTNVLERLATSDHRPSDDAAQPYFCTRESDRSGPVVRRRDDGHVVATAGVGVPVATVVPAPRAMPRTGSGAGSAHTAGDTDDEETSA